MGIFVLFASIFVVSLFLFVWALVCDIVANKRHIKECGYKTDYEEENIKFCRSKFARAGFRLGYSNWLWLIFAVMIVSFAVVLISGIIAIITQVNKEVYYQQTHYEYLIISEKLKEDKSNYFLMYEDITEYNNEIIKTKYWADNPWVNWYYNDKIADLPLIGAEYDNTNN